MNFTQAVSTCLRQYANFNGRAARPEFWWFALFQFAVFFVASIISPVLYGLVALGLLLPGLGVGVRRLHDIGRSGWWLLICFIPLIGVVLLIYWAVQPGEPGSNAYGAPAADVPAMIEGSPGQQ